MSNSLIELSKCMKCYSHDEELLGAAVNNEIGNCDHVICEGCFRAANYQNSICNDKPKCPLCQREFYEDLMSMQEALLIGKGSYLCLKATYYYSANDTALAYELYKHAIKKYEEALAVNATSLHTVQCLACCHDKCIVYCMALGREAGNLAISGQTDVPFIDIGSKILKNIDDTKNWASKLYENCYDIIERGFDSNRKPLIKNPALYCSFLGKAFNIYQNYSASLKYYKLAYEYSLRSSDHFSLQGYKDNFLRIKSKLALDPPLRFTIGDEVQVLSESDGRWKRAMVAELHYRERSFGISFTAPYYVRIFDSLSGSADNPSTATYAWVKADTDRYISKLGLRQLEKTRYQARLDAKVHALAHVYCSKEFIQNVYHELERDREFCAMLESAWEIDFSVTTLYLFRVFIMYRRSLLPNDSVYYVPSREEVVAEIRAFFDPADLPIMSACPDVLDSRQKLKVIDIKALRHLDVSFYNDLNSIVATGAVEAYFPLAFISYMKFTLSADHPVGALQDLRTEDSAVWNGFSGPAPVTCLAQGVVDLIGKAKCSNDFLAEILMSEDSTVHELLYLWHSLMVVFDQGTYKQPAECPFVYFFVRYCLDQGLGVPKPVLAAYDRMNLQLSSEFIGCANPSCERNRLDQSSGRVQFKKCSRCKTVSYCSRECQAAHYPEHKTLCRASKSTEA